MTKPYTAHVNVLIVGAGPAGMFAADELTKAGVKDITILEMGKAMEQRRCPESKQCKCVPCDILEGEGGAGGFSDGKKTYSLSRGTQLEELFHPDLEPLLSDIDDRIVHFSNEGYWFDEQEGPGPKQFQDSPFEFGTYPLRHIGTDGVRDFIINYGDYLGEQGVAMAFNQEVKGLISKDGKVIGALVRDVQVGDTYHVMANHVILATGLQGAPWVERLLQTVGLPMGNGPAGIGIRLEAFHKALAPLFDQFYDFKLVYQHDGLTFRSFCCNQQGYIVNENHRTLGIRNVNGHSFLDPDKRSTSSNFAIICKVEGEDYPNPQNEVRQIAWAINELVGGHTVAQRAEDFVAGVPTPKDRITSKVNRVRTNFQSRGGVDITSAMPGRIAQGFQGFLSELNKVIPVIGGDSMVYAPEVKYYGFKSPVDFSTWRCQGIDGLHIVGNASGYLDSFVSAALTGIVAARDIINQIEGGN